MKRAVLGMLERLGYVVIHADAWRSLHRRLADAEARLQRPVVVPPPAPPPAPADIAEEQQLIARLSELQSRLDDCVRDRNQARLQISRAEIRADAFQREHVRIESELKSCRDELARSDPSSTIRALEDEIGRLRQRLGDLDTYLEETRAAQA